MGCGKAFNILRDLQRLRLILITEGSRFGGAAGGQNPNQYWLTYSDELYTPNGGGSPLSGGKEHLHTVKTTGPDHSGTVNSDIPETPFRIVGFRDSRNQRSSNPAESMRGHEGQDPHFSGTLNSKINHDVDDVVNISSSINEGHVENTPLIQGR